MEYQVLKVLKALQGHLGNTESRVTPVRQDHQDLQENTESRVTPVRPDLQESQDIKVRQVNQDYQVSKDHPDHPDRPENQAAAAPTKET